MANFSGRRRSHRQRGACDDFVNLEDLSSPSSKMLIGVEFTCVHIDKCVRRVFVVLCISKKKHTCVVSLLYCVFRKKAYVVRGIHLFALLPPAQACPAGHVCPR
jgi:hypothetical protein